MNPAERAWQSWSFSVLSNEGTFRKQTAWKCKSIENVTELSDHHNSEMLWRESKQNNDQNMSEWWVKTNEAEEKEMQKKRIKYFEQHFFFKQAAHK